MLILPTSAGAAVADLRGVLITTAAAEITMKTLLGRDRYGCYCNSSKMCQRPVPYDSSQVSSVLPIMIRKSPDDGVHLASRMHLRVADSRVALARC